MNKVVGGISGEFISAYLCVSVFHDLFGLSFHEHSINAATLIHLPTSTQCSCFKTIIRVGSKNRF